MLARACTAKKVSGISPANAPSFAERRDSRTSTTTRTSRTRGKGRVSPSWYTPDGVPEDDSRPAVVQVSKGCAQEGTKGQKRQKGRARYGTHRTHETYGTKAPSLEECRETRTASVNMEMWKFCQLQFHCCQSFPVLRRSRPFKIIGVKRPALSWGWWQGHSHGAMQAPTKRKGFARGAVSLSRTE